MKLNYEKLKVDNKFNRYHILKLGLFLHDAGKPGSKTTDSTGRVHFKGHEVIGEKIGRRNSYQFKFIFNG